MKQKLFIGIGVFTCAGIIALLYSTGGFIANPLSSGGSQADSPYVSAEIKEKLAKAIEPGLTDVPKDFFETFNYLRSNPKEWAEILNVLNTQEEKQFWDVLIRLRAQMLGTAALAAEDVALLDERLADPAVSPVVLADVLAYEKAHPYTPDLKEITEARMFMIGMALSNMPIPPGEEETEKYIEQWGGRDTAKFFQKVRTEILRHYETALQERQAGKTPKNYRDEQRAQNGVAEYTVHMLAPVLYPAELMFAEFVLSPTDDDVRYAYPTLFFKNASSIHSVRLENEKPLPYKLDLMWYSLTENKVYSLETDLPRETLKEKIMNASGEWDALLVTLEPAGKVTLYAYNQVNSKKENLAAFQAEAQEIPFARFQESFAQYDARENPSKDWNEYRQTALEHFPKAKENLKRNGRPITGAEINYWEENPDNIFEGLPEPEKINTPDQDGFTPLLNAVRHTKGNTVSALLKEGANVNYQTPSGETALSLAVSGNEVSFVRELIAAGANVNLRDTSSGRTPLILAAMIGNNEIVRLLLDAGADVNARLVLNGQELQENALSVALENNNAETAEILRKAGAEELAPAEISPEVQQAAAAAYGDMGFPPLHQAVILNDAARLKELLDSGADVNALSPVGLTPLMFASQTGNAEMVKLLLAAGADVNAKIIVNGTETEQTALQFATDAEFEEIVRLLKEAGAK